MLSIPTGYTLLEPVPGLQLLVRHDLEPLVQRLGLTRFPERPRTAEGDPGPAGGRGSVWRMELGDGRQLVIKHYRRGGLLGRIRGRSYAGASRPLEEMRVCAAAHAAGLDVPLIQCLWIERAGPFNHRLAAATVEIPGTRDLFQALDGCRDTGERRQLLTTTAGAVRKLHDTGIHHPDLNLGNILVAGGNGSSVIHFIDFDRARLRSRPLGSGERNVALARMYRSLVKLSRPERAPLTADEKELFLSGYWGKNTGSHNALRRRCRRELALHRLWWRFNPPRAEG